MGTDNANQTPEMYICTGPGQYEKLVLEDFPDGYASYSLTDIEIEELTFPYTISETNISESSLPAVSVEYPIPKELRCRGKKRFRKMAMSFRDVDRGEIETWENIVRAGCWDYTGVYFYMLLTHRRR